MLRVVAIIDSSLSKKLAVQLFLDPSPAVLTFLPWFHAEIIKQVPALSCCVKANTSIGASDNGQWL